LGPILDLLDMAGIAVFALSGALLAAVKKQTLVTFLFFAIVTGIGGGTVRDLLIGAPVFWVRDLHRRRLVGRLVRRPDPRRRAGRHSRPDRRGRRLRPARRRDHARLGAARLSRLNLGLDLIERSINTRAMMTRLLFALLLLAPAAANAQDVTIADRREADGTLTLSHEVVVAAPAAEIWAAISTPEGWRTWAVPVSWTAPDDPGSIESSYTPTARHGDPSIIRQHFIARLPGRLLVFRTTRAPQGFPHFDVYARVTSFFEIEALDARRTRVRLTGTGYADNEAGRLLAGFFRDGNRVSLERLRDRFVNGPIDWTARR
jgi:uncharacterized protein YndB with AHSA1/START domain